MKIVVFMMAVLMAVAPSPSWVEAQDVPDTITYVSMHPSPPLDTDGDGCLDAAETSPYPETGGMRDPTDPYDYFEVTRDGRIDTLDTTKVAFRWGSEEGDLLYNPKFDRSVELVTGPFDLGPPDGGIDISDLQVMYNQFGHTCGPVTVTVDVTNDCGGNVRESTEPPTSAQECVIVRDDAGTIVDVVLAETTIEKGPNEPICEDCGGPAGSPSGSWYGTSASVKNEAKSPPARICGCLPVLGCYCYDIPHSQVVWAGVYMTCEWNYFDGSYDHPYDGVIADIGCRRHSEAFWPFRVETEHPIDGRWVVFGFQAERWTSTLFSDQPISGIIIAQFTLWVEIGMGPWDSYWTYPD